MYKTKMVKIYLPIPVCLFSLIVNLLFLGIQPFRAIAQSESDPNTEQAANNAPVTIEPEILSEINRVRTNPQGYAEWLESQRQYYDGIWLKFPGEKPVRTNKGLKALEEAIAVLKEQQPLSALSQSEATAAIATEKLNNFATANNIQNISYGRTTPKGIVMSLVVDELFPDRRRRNSLLSANAENTGVVCKPDPRYAKVCAIAYSDSAVDVAQTKPEPPATPQTQTATSEPESEPELEVSQTPTPEPDVPPSPPETTTEDEEIEVAAETLPQPPQTQTPPEPEPEPEESADDSEEQVEVFEAESEPEEVATNSDSSRIIENVERGILEEGDRVIAEDGSFYDSYPLEAKSDESFIIYLESEEFDAFVALVDAQGNIIDQNDDIDEENSNSRIRVTIPENGTYNVIVNAYDEGGTGEYVLTVRR